MDSFRESVKEQVVQANRGPFGGWWEALLELDPELLRRIHVYLQVAENSGPISERVRHLLWAAVDAVVTHLYPRGLGVHALLAVQNGASVREVVEALSIAATVSSRGYGRALPLVLKEMESAGLSFQDDEVADTDRQAVKARLERELGDWPEWMESELEIAPQALAAFLDLAHGRSDADGLDPVSRELIFVAAASCPAIVDQDMSARYIRRAFEAGASPEEVVQAIRLANGIGLHPISEGVMQIKDHEIGLT